MSLFSRFACLLLALAGTLLLVAGCENTIDPLRQDAGYSIYGTLSMNDAMHVVRVRDLSTPFTAEATESLDVTVTLNDDATGERIPMRDSVVAFDGVFTHNFRARASLDHDAQYSVVVEDPEGVRTTVRTRTPPVTQVRSQPDSADCLRFFTVTFAPVQSRSLIGIDVGYVYNGRRTWLDVTPSEYDLNGTVATFQFSPEETLAETIPSQDDLSTVQRLEPRCRALDDNRIFIAYTRFGEAGRSSGDPYDPSQSRIVENGLGSLGVLFRDTTFVKVDTVNAIRIF